MALASSHALVKCPMEQRVEKIALGYRAVDPQRPARKPLEEIVKDFQ